MSSDGGHRAKYNGFNREYPDAGAFDSRASERPGARIIAKLENFNPAGSVKDRIGVAMIEDAERDGKIKPDAVIIEPTSGNTGIGAGVRRRRQGLHAASSRCRRACRLERARCCKALGAEVVLTPAMRGHERAPIAKAEEMRREHARTRSCRSSSRTRRIRRSTATTAEEIWRDTDGEVDIFVAGVGTGGTITGVGEVLKQQEAGRRGIVAGRSPFDRRCWTATNEAGQAHASRASARASCPASSTARSSTRSCRSTTTKRSRSRARWPAGRHARRHLGGRRGVAAHRAWPNARERREEHRRGAAGHSASGTCPRRCSTRSADH